MALSLERSCVEAAFFIALAVATAVLHYTHGFSAAFANLSSQPAAAAAAASNSPLYNYACLLAAATAAYAAARTAACFAAAVLPPTVKSSAAARRGALALCVPIAALICYVGAGYPRVGGSVAIKWVARNWERNGERDLRWCARLFALLFFWQALFAGGIAACRALARGLSGLVAATASSAGTSSGSARPSKGENELERQPRHESDRSSGGEDKSSNGDADAGAASSSDNYSSDGARPSSGA